MSRKDHRFTESPVLKDQLASWRIHLVSALIFGGAHLAAQFRRRRRLSAAATGGVGGVIVAGGAQGAANSAVQSQGTISPTIRVRMGEPIRVFTARDLDFSTAG